MKINHNQHITKKGIVKRNPAKKNNVEILKKYMNSRYANNMNFFYVEFVPPSVALKLTTGFPQLDLQDVQNNSPEAKEMIEIAEKYKGWLGGYVVNDPKRDDNRVSFDTLFLPIKDELRARKLQDELKADEFSKYQNSWRYWWD